METDDLREGEAQPHIPLCLTYHATFNKGLIVYMCLVYIVSLLIFIVNLTQLGKREPLFESLVYRHVCGALS